MLLYWVNFLYRLWGEDVPYPTLSIVDSTSDALSGHIYLTGCLLVLTLYFLWRIKPSGGIYLLVSLGWKCFWVWGFPGAPIWTGWSQLWPTTTGAVRLYYVPTPWTPWCTGVWPAPKWWQSYSWRIQKSYSTVDAILMWGGWLSFSG